MARFKVSDGSSWPLPQYSLELDALGWRLVHRPDSITDADKRALASVLDAYEYLLVHSTREKRDLVCREARAALAD
jgi:hypothetical protein